MATERDYNSYNALKAKSPQACEFCDQQFNNRFNSIIHNSSHIIIPLLKHQICFCDICYIYFTSTDDFHTHKSDKHHPVINHNNDIDVKVPEIKLEKLPQFNNAIFEVKEEFDGNEYDDSSSEDETLLEIVKRETARKYIQDEINDEDYTGFIKSHLKFEVDTKYDGLLNDSTTDCEVNIQYMWSKDKDIETSNGKTKSITNCIVYEDPVDEFELNNAILNDIPLKSDEEYKSVHYSDLMSFGYYCCQYCYAYFSNRFTLIIHETSHIRIKKIRNQYLQCPHCDVYIAGNYRTMQKHETAVHSDQQELRTCEICGLRYKKYTRHKQIYHYKADEPLETSKKKMARVLVETGQELIEEPDQASILGLVQKPVYNPNWIEKFFTIKVCDLCFSFFKNSFKKGYILKGTFRYTTERPCDECKKLFYILKTVRTIVRINKNQINRCSTYVRSTLRIENRLKKIQTRLKMFNKLGKVYNDLLLMFLTIAIFIYF